MSVTGVRRRRARRLHRGREQAGPCSARCGCSGHCCGRCAAPWRSPPASSWSAPSRQVAGPALIAYRHRPGPARAARAGLVAARRHRVRLPAHRARSGAVLIAWYTVLTARISQAMLIDLRKRVFLHTQRLSLEFHENYTSGRIISRQTSDLDSIKRAARRRPQPAGAGRACTWCSSRIAMFIVDWVSGLILLGALVPLLILTRWFQLRSQKLFRRTRVASARMIVQFVETMTGIRAVQGVPQGEAQREGVRRAGRGLPRRQRARHPGCSASTTPGSC